MTSGHYVSLLVGDSYLLKLSIFLILIKQLKNGCRKTIICRPYLCLSTFILFIPNNYSYKSQTIPLHFSMQRKQQIQRLLNMQNLLTEYQRENQTLNNQVLELLAQNKALKIHHINSESLNVSRKSNRKVSRQSRKLVYQDENVIDKMWKLKREEKSREKERKVEKKDEGVQVKVETQVRNSPTNQGVDVYKQGHKTLASDLYSFGAISMRDQVEIKPQQKKVDMATSPPKSPEPLQPGKDSVNQVSELFELKTPIMEIQESQQSRFDYSSSTKLKQLSPTKKIKQKIENKTNRSRGRSSHAIEPCLAPSSSQSRFSEMAKKKTFLSRISKQQSSTQRMLTTTPPKRKSFIQVMTTSEIKQDISKRISRNKGCC